MGRKDLEGLLRAIILLVLVALIAISCKAEQNLREIAQEPLQEEETEEVTPGPPQLAIAELEPPVCKTLAIAPPSEPAPAPEPDPEPVTEPEPQPIRYPITEAERTIVEAVVAAEAKGEDFEGQCLVAECILNTAEARDMRPDAVVLETEPARQYAEPDYENRHLVAEAVSAVFDDGYTVTDEPIRYFYAPKYTTSSWHERSLTFVLEHGGHRFFKEK